jgi:pimeloyl-ACP methyl ester carboxylesterase
VRRADPENWPYGPAWLYVHAARRRARILGWRRLRAGLGALPHLDAEIAREIPPEHTGAARAITLSTRQRHTAVREILMLARMSGRPPRLGALPLAVVTAGNQPPGWFEMQDELASLSSRSTHVIVGNARHYVHLDDPEVVTRAIRELASRVLAE